MTKLHEDAERGRKFSKVSAMLEQAGLIELIQGQGACPEPRGTKRKAREGSDATGAAAGAAVAARPGTPTSPAVVSPTLPV